MTYIIRIIGLSGGIVIAWLKNLDQFTLFHSNKQIMFGVIFLPNEPSWIIGVVFASTLVYDCHDLWSQILNVLHLDISMLII